jgi:conjugative transfer region protein (TIGR03748 family)
MRNKIIISGVLIGASIMSVQSFADIQKSRYVTTNTGLASYQKNLLSQTVNMTFPASIKTIGEAVNYLLRFSGYSVVNVKQQSEAMQAIMSQELPETLRQINNATITQALLGLVGDSFQVLYDPVHRLISFSLKPKEKPIYDAKNIQWKVAGDKANVS